MHRKIQLRLLEQIGRVNMATAVFGVVAQIVKTGFVSYFPKNGTATQKPGYWEIALRA